MKKFLLLFIAITVCGCEFSQTESTKKSNFSSFSKNTIEFKQNTIILTSGYSKIKPEEFADKINGLSDASKFKKIALHELKKIRDKKVDFEIFADEKNVENYIFIYTCDFYQLNEQRAARIVSSMNNQLKDESNIQEVKYKRIHGRFFFTPTSKVVKLKYLKAYKKEKKFQTEYIVASKDAGGIGLLISNLENIDFESSIKRLALK